ncbi:MAG: PLP-dependent aminotransferase family protein [Acidobacteriota bacterium]
MTIALARRMEVVRASDIRELLKLTARPSVISFAGGLPAAELFPVVELAEVARRVLLGHGSRALQYSTTEGHPPLRSWIQTRMNSLWGTRYSADEVLVTTGSQQALDLVGKLLIDDGDEVLCESPTYLGAISAWNVFRPRWVEVPTDDEGMDITALEKLLDRCTRPKLIYVVPNFQNPSGRTWSLRRRHELAEVARRRGVPIVEDNPYGEVRFEGEHLPAAASFDSEGLVISLGTFSKVLCPGLRVAWVAASRPLHAGLVTLKQGADLHTSTLDQMILTGYLETYDLDANVRRVVAAYRERRDAMIRALAGDMPAGVRFSRPQGGLFLWVELPAGIDTRELLVASLACDVAFVPGESFFPVSGRRNTMRLNFSAMPPERIGEGIRRLAALVGEVLARTSCAREAVVA